MTIGDGIGMAAFALAIPLMVVGVAFAKAWENRKR